ncbi:hypothetical protein BCR33DRAFT_724794 [Rhizoclosmatium globosum]|uniref:Uncharacterized protein n=1 Tax=Rhizoclosmatium globosum TaxID=329046 RepID=A0A1Y2B413_9FUNG|nr:hypothetical protein BCR33DRAFT_724794 [Rhizoclosmatium globosum]|eukprot:ORY29290.1 hypothetical protein BCR33DRAFT_724794 [Rhizoclosmatium globosum]
MYFCRGSLPWQGLKAATKKQKYDRIRDKKLSTSPATLCAGFPREFEVYLNYVRGLRFDDKPDYAFLKKLIAEEGETFDWVVRKYVGMSNGDSTPMEDSPMPQTAQSQIPLTTGAPTPNRVVPPQPQVFYPSQQQQQQPLSRNSTTIREYNGNGNEGYVEDLVNSRTSLANGLGSQNFQVPPPPQPVQQIQQQQQQQQQPQRRMSARLVEAQAARGYAKQY